MPDQARGGPMRTIVMPGWLPAPTVNARRHWAAVHRTNQGEYALVYAFCKHGRLRPIVGKARLTITLVFPQNRRRDTDNLYARVKSTVDAIRKGGWIRDDSTEWLELVVRAEVRPGIKQTELLLEPARAAGSGEA